MRGLLVGLLLAGALLVGSGGMGSTPSAAHPGTIYCGWNSVDQKYLGLYDWASATVCTGGDADLISAASWLQYWHWDTTSPYLGWWVLANGIPTGLKIRPLASVAEVQGLFFIPSYVGISCVRTVGFHAVTHGNLILGVSDSGLGQCF